MSNTYAVSSPSRQLWGQIFGQFVQEAREQDGRSVEEAARLAGMKASEWEAVEAGQVPLTWKELDDLAAGLNADRSWIGSLVILCVVAWEKK